MKKTALILCMFCIIGLPLLHAEWLHNGVPVTDSPYAKTVGEFGAMLIFTDKPDELFTAWNKDILTVSADYDVEEIRQYDSLTAAIIFSNCTPDEKGMANLTVEFTVLDPNGKIVKESGESEVWVNRPAPAKRMLELSIQYLSIGLGEKYVPGLRKIEENRDSDHFIDNRQRYATL